MKTQKNILLAILFIGFSAQAQENPFLESAALSNGGVQGGGGDSVTEERIKFIRDDLYRWIKMGSARDLQFPDGITYGDYRNGNPSKGLFGMLDVLKPGAVVINAIRDIEQRMDDEEMNTYVAGYPKTCKGFISKKDRRPHIVCSIERFWDKRPGWTQDQLETEQYQLIHHEYASLGRFEQNVGSDSDMSISRQISKRLRKVTQLMLVVDNTPVFTQSAASCFQQYTSEETRALADIKTKRKRRWIVVGRNVALTGGIVTGFGVFAGSYASGWLMTAIAEFMGLAHYISDVQDGDGDISLFSSTALSRIDQAVKAVEWSATGNNEGYAPKKIQKLIRNRAEVLLEPDLKAYEKSIENQPKVARKELLKRWMEKNENKYLGEATAKVRSLIATGVESGAFCDGYMHDIRDIRNYVEDALETNGQSLLPKSTFAFIQKNEFTTETKKCVPELVYVFTDGKKWMDYNNGNQTEFKIHFDPNAKNIKIRAVGQPGGGTCDTVRIKTPSGHFVDIPLNAAKNGWEFDPRSLQ